MNREHFINWSSMILVGLFTALVSTIALFVLITLVKLTYYTATTPISMWGCEFRRIV